MEVQLTTLCENTTDIFGFTGEWGLSILIRTDEKTVLMDTGMTDIVLKNSTAAKIDLNLVDKIVLSHGHVDHTGGLRGVLQAIGKEVEIIAHPEVWGNKYYVLSDMNKDRYDFVGIPFRKEELESLGARFTLKSEQVWISDMIVTTGEVPMVTPFEEVDKDAYIKAADKYVHDDILDDQAVVVLTEKGLVVILGCAHRGIINTLLHAQKITGIDRIHMVVGGTHLYHDNQERLEKTVRHLKEFNIGKIGVSHCTGLSTAVVLAKEFGDRFFFNNSGNVITI